MKKGKQCRSGKHYFPLSSGGHFFMLSGTYKAGTEQEEYTEFPLFFHSHDLDLGRRTTSGIISRTVPRSTYHTHWLRQPVTNPPINPGNWSGKHWATSIELSVYRPLAASSFYPKLPLKVITQPKKYDGTNKAQRDYQKRRGGRTLLILQGKKVLK